MLRALRRKTRRAAGCLHAGSSPTHDRPENGRSVEPVARQPGKTQHRDMKRRGSDMRVSTLSKDAREESTLMQLPQTNRWKLPLRTPTTTSFALVPGCADTRDRWAVHRDVQRVCATTAAIELQCRSGHAEAGGEHGRQWPMTVVVRPAYDNRAAHLAGELPHAPHHDTTGCARSGPARRRLQPPGAATRIRSAAVLE